MKKVVLTLTASLACLAAFAQGKISFQTDSLHLAYFSSGPNAGTAISSANGSGLSADLYMGSSSAALFLYSSTTFSATPGKWNTVSVQANANASSGAPALAPGSTVFVVAQIRDSAHAAANSLDATLLQTPGYGTLLGYQNYGWSQEFQFTLGSSISYPFMYTAPGWAPGTFDLSGSAGAGAKGAIAVVVPEPTSMAMAGLGMAAMLIFRRRKA